MWSFDKKTHIYRANDGLIVPSVTEIIGEHIPSYINNIPENILEKARWRGECYHKCLELFNKGILDWDSVSPELVPLVKSWEKCIKDHDIQNIANEYSGVSKRSKYGFTIDNVSRFSKTAIQSFIIDYKTGVISKTIDLQLAGYINGWNEHYPNDEVKSAFYFKPIDENNYKFKPVDVEQAMYDFKTLCKASHIRRKYGK